MQNGLSFQKIDEVKIDNVLLFILIQLLAIFLLIHLASLFALLSPYHGSVHPWGFPWIHLIFIAIVIFAILIHDALHLIATSILGKVPFHDLKFNNLRKLVSPYIHCESPLRITVYKRILLFPIYIIVSTGLIAILMYPAGWLFTGIFLSFAMFTADIWMYIKLSSLENNVFVNGHPSLKHCDIFSQSIKE